MKRILFVDDDPAVLKGLRLSLRRKRSQWDMHFFSDGVLALQDMALQLPDVVVSDIRMFGMDGAELLARVAELAPEAVRIALSGEMDQEAAARAVRVAHRFLSKPCNSAVLEDVINRALDLREKFTSDFLRKQLSGPDALPSLPKAYHSLMNALRDPAVGVDTVAQIIETDTAMAAKVLQLINSPFFGLQRRVLNVRQAVSYLGTQILKSMVLVHCVFEDVGTKDLREMERQQAHALACARIARKLLPDKIAAEEAATAALLHDIGSLVLRHRAPREYAECQEAAAKQGVPISVAERERFGCSHAEVGAYVLELSGLPSEIAEAVAHHERPWEQIERIDAHTVLRIADWMAAEVFGTGSDPLDHGPPPPPDLLERLGLEPVITELRNTGLSFDRA